MLRPDREIERVYLHRAPIDMRKQIDGLSLLAQETMGLDPMSGALFAFINARRNKLKLLIWERNDQQCRVEGSKVLDDASGRMEIERSLHCM